MRRLMRHTLRLTWCDFVRKRLSEARWAVYLGDVGVGRTVVASGCQCWAARVTGRLVTRIEWVT